MTDLAEFDRRRRSNSWLAAPAGWNGARADQPTSAFDVPTDTLRDAWLDVLARMPRVRIGPIAPDEVEAVQRSRIFRFPDRITARFVPLAPNRSSLVVYSRSVYGRYDFGVNRRRVARWLAELAHQLRSAPRAQASISGPRVRR